MKDIGSLKISRQASNADAVWMIKSKSNESLEDSIEDELIAYWNDFEEDQTLIIISFEADKHDICVRPPGNLASEKLRVWFKNKFLDICKREGMIKDDFDLYFSKIFLIDGES